jgi:hypothetical protein
VVVVMNEGEEKNGLWRKTIRTADGTGQVACNDCGERYGRRSAASRSLFEWRGLNGVYE